MIPSALISLCAYVQSPARLILAQFNMLSTQAQFTLYRPHVLSDCHKSSWPMILCLLILATVVFVSPPGVVNYFQEIFITCVETVPGLWFSVLSGTHGTHNVITLGWGLIKLSLMELLAPWASSHHQPWPLAWLNTPILWSYILVYSPPSGVSPSSVSPVVASVMVAEGYCSHSLHLSLLQVRFWVRP